MKVSTLIEQLQDYQIIYGDIDVTICISPNIEEIRDILADEEGITLYN